MDSSADLERADLEERVNLEAALAGRGTSELFACDPALADTAAFCAAYGFLLVMSPI